ncbi:thiol-disulfide oxidoreductase ResA [Desertibacillus haloalkaliphilus]|uniref:thiol-disulfide oxidoreductase ResA n=1 Tax=Desertibacillus haloalkaliphilus TaxID=1328930 RepID=UPI001C26C72D|nr:thiol-disulfide oxidoreductase ResA [Desertibacillus haloalkaliphilus]MBU8907174.1 thiol-disulfide oxidoreductase ResA [Desertibacillus haloalkaliphilus]
MKKKRLLMRTTILSIIGVALAYTFYANFFDDTEVVNAGEEAVNFALTDLDGNRVELADLRGKGVFLNFWGTYCPPCEEEMPYMESQYQAYKDQGVEIIAVNVDEPELSVQRFVDRHNLTFPIVIDRGSNVLDAYGIRPLPTTILIDEHGTVVRKHIGGMTERDVQSFMEEIKPES